MHIEFKWTGGATWVLEIDDAVKFACDPVLCPAGTVQDYFWFKSRRLEDPSYHHSDFQSVDIWLITHGHEDHIDDFGILQIDPKANIITHKNALKIINKTGSNNISVLMHREIKEIQVKDYTVSIEAIPAIHGINPVTALFAGGVNGYWITVKKNKKQISIYVSSDTVMKRKLLKTLKGRRVDIFIPNIGAAKKGSWLMTLTLSAKMMKKLMDVIQPKITIPVHFGTFEHYVEPISEAKKLNDNSIRIMKPGDVTEINLTG